MLNSTYDNVISICGAGRNVGKTFLGESIISYFSSNNDVISIKISKFKHQNHDNDILKELCKTPTYTIWQELAISEKDSGRYLKAGAKISYYIECDDVNLLKAFLHVYNKLSKSCLVICESASITKYLKPSLSIFVKSKKYETPKNKLRSLLNSDLVLQERSIEMAIPQLFLSIQNNNWLVKYTQKIFCYV